MPWRLNPYAVSLFLTTGVTGILAVFASRRRRTPGAASFTWLMASQSLWTLGSGLELGSLTLETMLWCVRLQYIGIAGLAITWMWFTLSYAGYDGRSLRRMMRGLSVVPALTVFLNWTNAWHHLYYTGVALTSSGPFPLLVITRGPWYWVWVGYFYLTLIAGNILLAQVFLRTTRLYRNQARIILIGAALPWVINIGYMAGMSPFGSIDLTPYAFAVTGIAVSWGLFRHHLLDLGPVARHRVVESLADSVITLDGLSRVVDLNPAAERLCGLPAAQAVGRSLANLLPNQPELIRELSREQSVTAQIKLQQNQEGRFYELGVSSLQNRRNHETGRVVILHDVTERMQVEEDLRRAKALAEERSRAAEAANHARTLFLSHVSHELRTPLHAILGFSEILQGDANLTPEQHTALRTIHANGTQLLQLVNSVLDLTRAGTTTDPAAEWAGFDPNPAPVFNGTDQFEPSPETVLLPAWLADLRQATMQGDIATLRALANQIRGQDKALADQLELWIDGFAYDRILALSESLTPQPEGKMTLAEV